MICRHQFIVCLFAVYGIPDILHSDQGTNYHLSTDIGSIGNQQTSYHSLPPTVWWHGWTCTQIITTLCGKRLPLVLYAYHTAVYTLQQESHHLHSCSEESREVPIYSLMLHLTQTNTKVIYRTLWKLIQYRLELLRKLLLTLICILFFYF